jgi:hypothetical protein
MWIVKYTPFEYKPLWMYPRNESSEKLKSAIEAVSATTGSRIKKKGSPTHHDDFLYEEQREKTKTQAA